VDNPLSDALNAIATDSSHLLATSMISGNYTSWSILDSSLNFRAVYIRNRCASDSLALKLERAYDE
jgi:hypothetical protein